MFSCQYIWNRTERAHRYFIFPLKPLQYCRSITSICTLSGTSLIGTLKKQKINPDFSIDLKSANLLLTSVFRSAPAEAYVTVSVTMHYDRLGKCVKSNFRKPKKSESLLNASSTNSNKVLSLCAPPLSPIVLVRVKSSRCLAPHQTM